MPTQTAVAARRVTSCRASKPALQIADPADVMPEILPILTLPQKREFVRLEMLRQGIGWAISYLKYKKGLWLSQQPDEEIERMYWLAIEAPE